MKTIHWRKRHVLVAISAFMLADAARAQVPNHPVISEVYTDPNGLNDGPVGRDVANLHQEYFEIFVPPAGSLSPTLNKDSLRLTFYEVEGDSSSSGLGLINYRFDLPTIDIDPSNGMTVGAIGRPTNGVFVLGWVDYVGNPPTGLLGTPSTRVAMINGGVTTHPSGATFIAMNGAQFTGTTNFFIPTAENLIDLPSEASSGIIQNGSSAYLLMNRDAAGYVMLCDDAHAVSCPSGSNPSLPTNSILQTTALLDAFACNDHAKFDVLAQPYATPTGDNIDLETILPLGGAYSLLAAQVPESDGSTTFSGVANGYARRFVDIAKTTESIAADDPVVDATTAYRHVRNNGPFYATPGRAVLTTSAPELGVGAAAEQLVQVLAGTTGRPGLLTANVGGNYPINISGSPGASSNPAAVTFGAGTAATGVLGQTLSFPTVAVAANAAAANGAVATSTVTVTATNGNGGDPAVLSPLQATTLTATVLKPTTGLNSVGGAFQTTVFAAVQGIPASAALNEFRATSLGTFVANNLGGLAQGTFCTTIGPDCVPHAPILIDPATNLGNGLQMDQMIKGYPDQLCSPTPPNPPHECWLDVAGPAGKLSLLQTVVQSAEVVSGATTYEASIDLIGLPPGCCAPGVRARRVNIPDTLAFGGPFTPSETIHFADATGRAGQARSGLTNATTTRTFELAILDTNVRNNSTLETGANDDFGIIIEVAATEVGSPVVPGEFVFLSFTGGLQGADIDGVEVPPGNSIATVIYLDTDNLHSVLGIRVIEAIFLLDAGNTGDLDPVEVFSLNPSTIPPTMVASVPSTGQSLWRTTNNIARLTFSQNITAPLAGQVEIRQMLPNGLFGADLSSGFTITLENDGAAQPRILKIVDNGASDLIHRNWYAIRNIGGWTTVANFTVQYVVQIGDATNDGQVVNLDASTVNAGIPNFTPADNDRRNIDGDGAILNADVSAVNARIPSFVVPKPTGH